MKRPQLVNLELEDLSTAFTAIPDYIEKLENKIKNLELQLYGVNVKVAVVNPPNNLAM